MVCKSHSVLNEISCKYTKTRTSHLIHVQGTCRKPNITDERGAHAYAWAPTIHSVILFFYLQVSERYRINSKCLSCYWKYVLLQIRTQTAFQRCKDNSFLYFMQLCATESYAFHFVLMHKNGTQREDKTIRCVPLMVVL